MKNIAKVMVAALSIFLLAGCGSKNANETFTCRFTQEDTTFTITQDISIEVKDGTIDNAKLVNEMIFSNEYVGNIDGDAIVSALESQFSSYKKVDVSKTSTGAIVTIELDSDEFATLSGVDKDELKNIKESDIPEIKSGLEEAGYTCK